MYSPSSSSQNMYNLTLQNPMVLAHSNPMMSLHAFSVRHRRPSIPTSDLNSSDVRSRIGSKSNKRSER